MNYMKNLNAIDEQMADELMYVVDAAEKDPNVKVVVLKGTDRAFSAGGDIGYFYNLIQAGGEVNMDGLIGKVGVVADGSQTYEQARHHFRLRCICRCRCQPRAGR